MFSLALLTLRARAGSFIASFVALFFGASLVLACGSLLETGIRTDTPPQRLRDAQIVITGDQFYPEPIWLSEADVAIAAAIPGVQKATPHTVSQAGKQKIDTIAVSLDPSRTIDDVKTLLDQKLAGQKVSLLTGDARGQAEFADAKPSQETLIVLAAVFGGIAVMVTILIVSSTLSLSIQQRLREMALMRAIGALPSQLRRMIVGETLSIGLLATAFAPLLAAPLGKWIFAQLVQAGVVSSHIVLHQDWLPMLVSGVLVIVSSLGAALLATRAATKVRPIEALGHAAQPQRWATWPRLLFAGALIAGGVAVAIVTATLLRGPVAASTVGATATLWAIAFALLAPGVASILLFCLSLPTRALGGLAGYLGMLNLRARTRRVANVIIPIMLTTGLATSMLYMQTTLAASAQEVFAHTLRSDAIVTSSSGGIALSDVATLQTLPEVSAVSALATSSGFFANDDGSLSEDADSDTVSIQGLSAPGASVTTGFNITQGSLDLLQSNTIALTTARAESLHKKIGDTVTMQLGDGTVVHPKIIALFETPPGYETILMPAEVVVPHTKTGLASQLLVTLAHGYSITNLQASLSRQNPALHATSRAESTALFNKGEQTGVWINLLLAGMIIGYTVIGLVNSLVVSIMERKREFALQRLIGSTKSQLFAMLTIEGLVTAIAGAIFGVFIAALILVPFTLGLNGTLLPQGSAWIFGAIVVFTTLLTLVTSWAAAFAALRGNYAELAGNRE